MVKNGKELGLAFWKKAAEIAQLVKAGLGIVVMPTGTGKTTQVGQLLHELGETARGLVYVSVPKRVLAVELATRVAAEMGVALGSLVGYEIRGERRVSRQTQIIFLTEGLLRAKIRSNPTLTGVAMVVFDEFHQRSLLSDFNVALVERARHEGSSCGMLLMSATVDPSYLAAHFQCGVVDGSDLVTTYPIAEEYVGPVAERNIPQAVAGQVARLALFGIGNGLVFCDGKAMINEVVAAIKKLALPSLTVLPLHGELDGKDRHAPFEERPGVTVTVATDVVETGATLPGIGWVVDTGLAKVVGYDPIADISSLRSEPVAQDRLRQRIGRCGRVRPGVYVGLYSEEDALARPERTVPEIFRVALREVVLTIKAMGLSREGQPIRLIDSPAKGNWQQAKRQLQQLGLVAETPEAEITTAGQMAVQLGCDPREAAMLLASAALGCLDEMATAVSARQAKRLLYSPKGEEWEAQAAHARFKTGKLCDAWTAVQVLRAADERGEEVGQGEWCRENFVAYRSLAEVRQGKRQLLSDMARLGFQPNDEPATERQLAQAIAYGLPDRVFCWEGSREGYYQQDNPSNRVVLGRESVVTPSREHNVVAWEIIEIKTQRGGTLRLITNASVI